MHDEMLRPLLKEAWAEWERVRRDETGALVVPEASAPVLWFGSHGAYSASARRVLTLGVNPGPRTFPGLGPWSGFPSWQPPADPRNVGVYRAGCDAYPVGLPAHAPWFSAWTPLVEPLGASWAADSTAGRPLHVDLSPIATSRRFSELPSHFKTALRVRGMAILKPLVDALRPDITVASLSVGHFEAMETTLGVSPHTRVPTPRGEAWVCSWSAHGVLLWVRKTGMAPVDFTREQRASLGEWVRRWLDRKDGRPAPSPRSATSAATHLEHPDADGPGYTLRDVVSDMCSAFAGDWREGLPTGRPPHWRPRGAGLGWAHRWRFLAPDGRLAELSTQARPERVREFLEDWRVYGAQMESERWDSRYARAEQHIVFPVGRAMKHYPGLYFRWVTR